MPSGSYTLLVEAWDLSLRRVLHSVVTGVVVDERAWAIACLPASLDGIGTPALADYAGAVSVSSYTSPSAHAALVHPRSGGLFSFEAGSPLDAPVEAALARLVARARP